MVLPLGSQLSRVGVGDVAVAGFMVGSMVSRLVTKGLGGCGSFLVPGLVRLPPGPWSVRLLLVQHYISGSTGGGPITVYTDRCKSCWALQRASSWSLENFLGGKEWL